MSNLTELVPPLELCKLIPAGEFADSVFCWIDRGHTCVLPDEVIPPEQHPFVELRRYTIQGDEIPAPTLQEIMEELPHSMCYRHANPGRFTMRTGNRFETVIRANNPSTAALKLWLKLKGIEYGQQAYVLVEQADGTTKWKEKEQSK